MLVLSRKVGESIRIGDNVTITVTSVAGNRVRIGIDAPQTVSVRRTELLSPLAVPQEYARPIKREEPDCTVEELDAR